jgi:hypothetical protein
MKDSDTERGTTHRSEQLLEQACAGFRDQWGSGRQPKIEDYLNQVAEPARHLLLRELIAIELQELRSAGQAVKLWEYYQRFPQQPQCVDAALRLLNRRKSVGGISTAPTDETVARVPAEEESTPEELTGLMSEGTFSWGTETRQIAHFQLLEHLGEGRFGSVWKARDPKLDRVVAIKIPRDAGGSQRQIDLFLREARSAAQVRHSNIVSIYEVGREADMVYMATEFIQGVNLKQYLSSQGPRSPRKAAEFCAKVADALHCAHEAGVIHRDLKPSNIMVDVKGEPHVADFGLAKRRADLTMTVEGQVIGTPAYMSPEQADGQARTADRRTDIYSVGVILFEMLTGELPFRGDRQMLIMQKLENKAPSPRQLNSRVPRDLETICLKCLERDVEKRYVSCEELTEDLRCFIDGEPIQARAIGGLERMWRSYARSPHATALSAGAYLICFALVLLLWTAIGWSATAAGLTEVSSLAIASAEYGGLASLVFVPMLLCGLRILNGSYRFLIVGAALLLLYGILVTTLLLRLPMVEQTELFAPFRTAPAARWQLFGLLASLTVLGLAAQVVAIVHGWSRRIM